MWTTLTIVAVIALVVFWRGPNAVWGGVTFGLVGGLVYAVVVWLFGPGFEWSFVGRGLIIGALAGLVFELVGRIAARQRRKEEET